MQSLVSVIIPVYNAEKYVEETVNSVIESTYRDIEVICIDDGSKDNSLSILQNLAMKDDRIKVLHQENAGVCTARNNAIHASAGKYIFPLDADDILMPEYIAKAVKILDNQSDVKVVTMVAEFFGDKAGVWKLPEFSLEKLARKNIMCASAMYRREDYNKTDGYCAEIIAREDWEFWIALLKNGGKVVKIPEVSLRYRVTKGSKRERDRDLKHHVIDVLNRRHPDFFNKYLGGPLRYYRSWSKIINFFTNHSGDLR